MGRMTSHIWNGKKCSKPPTRNTISDCHILSYETAIFCEDSGCSDLKTVRDTHVSCLNHRYISDVVIFRALLCEAQHAQRYLPGPFAVKFVTCSDPFTCRMSIPLSAILKGRFQGEKDWKRGDFSISGWWCETRFFLMDIIPETASRRIFRMDVESIGG